MRRYLVIVASVSLLVFACVIGINLWVDPYRIVHPLLGPLPFEPDARVQKMEYLMRDCSRFDSYLLGDSRAATLRQEDLGPVGAHRFYNLATFADNIISIVPKLTFLLRRNCPMSAIVVDESLDTLMDASQVQGYELLRREDPAMSGENRLAFYSSYFLSVEALETYLLARQRNGSVRYLYYPDGHADFLWAMPDGAPFAQASCGTPRFSASQKALMPVRLAAYRQLAELSRAHGFKAVVWIAPLNRWENTGLLADPDFAQFLRQLHAIANLTVVEPDWNSALLADFHAWHDCGHFRREVFDQLLAPSISKQLVANRGD